MDFKFSTEWLLSEDTDKLKKFIYSSIEEMKEMWANGNFTGASESETIQLNSKAIGAIQFADTLLEYLEYREE